MLNRSAVILRPSQPYLDWARAVSREAVEPDPQGKATVWLVPGVDEEEDIQDMLQQGWSALFENMLTEWSSIESEWPQERTYEMFREWFEVDVHSLVFDLVDGPLGNEE